MFRIFFPLHLILFFPVANAQHIVTYSDSNFYYRLQVDDTAQCSVRSITISRIKDNRQVQVIIPEDNWPFCPFDSGDKQKFTVEDMNFDGYNDFRLLTIMPATGRNEMYLYWVYDTQLKMFVADTYYNKADELTEPEFDPKTKTITCYYSMGTAGSSSAEYVLCEGKLRLMNDHSSSYNSYTGDYLESATRFIYINNAPVVDYSKEDTFDEKRKLIITTTKNRVNGKLKMKNVKTVKAKKSKY